MVRRPPRARSASASETTCRISFTPAITAENGTKRAPATWAMSEASVVLPVPGGPQRIIEWSRPSSRDRRSTLPGPIRCCWPTTSSRLRGRIRSARGAGGAGAEETGGSKRSTCEVYAAEKTSPEGEGSWAGEGDGKIEERVDARGDHDAAALQLGRIRSIGDEGNAAGLRGHAIDPGIAHHHDVLGGGPALAHHAEPVGIGLEGGDVVAGDHEIEVAEEIEAGEDEVGDHAVVVRPDRGGEAELAQRLERLRGMGLEHRLLHGAPLVRLGDGEDLDLEVWGMHPHVAEDLRARPTQLAHGERDAALAHEGLHLAAHGLEIERRADEGVVEVEDADGRMRAHDLRSDGLVRRPGGDRAGARCRRGRGCDRPRSALRRWAGSAGCARPPARST